MNSSLTLECELWEMNKSTTNWRYGEERSKWNIQNNSKIYWNLICCVTKKQPSRKYEISYRNLEILPNEQPGFVIPGFIIKYNCVIFDDLLCHPFYLFAVQIERFCSRNKCVFILKFFILLQTISNIKYIVWSASFSVHSRFISIVFLNFLSLIILKPMRYIVVRPQLYLD